MPLRETALAKINLSIKVLGRRADRYHGLESLVVFADVGDVLTASEAPSLTLDLAGPFAAVLVGEVDNLVLRAAREFSQRIPRHPGAQLTLEKNLPVASGIGGGSADAAAVLRLLARLWNAVLEENELASLALCLGADVPVCLDPRPALMWGRGELIRRLDAMPPFWLVLANPGIAVSTAEIFKALNAPDIDEMTYVPPPPPFPALDALIGYLTDHGNDLEAPARKIVPEIGEVVAALTRTKNCRLARMSGSGATCFGIYADEETARAAAAEIMRDHPHWWVVAAARA